MFDKENNLEKNFQVEISSCKSDKKNIFQSNNVKKCANQNSFESEYCNVNVLSEKIVEKQNCISEVETASETYSLNKELAIPEGYEFLPLEFFPYEGILPPLVSKSWLKLLKEKLEDDEFSNYTSEEEDSMPLAKLKNMLIQERSQCPKIDPTLFKHDEAENSFKMKKKIKKKVKKDDNFHQKEANKKYPLINRKRGRPKKKDQNETFINETDQVFINSDKDFWEEQTNSPILDFHIEEEINSPENQTVEENIVREINSWEHDYSKADINFIDNKLTQNEDKSVSKNQNSALDKCSNKKNTSKSNFPCLECGKSFSASSTLKNHQRIHNGTLIKCPECHKGFMTKYLLKCHMRIHSGDLFMCHKCKKGFTTAELLKVHTRCHTGDKPFVCNICGRSFPCASNLSQHKQTHDSEKKFLCSHCGSSFNQKRCLDGHMLRHSEKNHICTVCGKLWARKPDLVEHMRVHTGVKPYCCSACSQKFTQASSLKRHQTVHMNVKPIQCSVCNKMFKCQDYYKRHLRKHEKESPYLLNSITKCK